MKKALYATICLATPTVYLGEEVKEEYLRCKDHALGATHA